MFADWTKIKIQLNMSKIRRVLQIIFWNLLWFKIERRLFVFYWIFLLLLGFIEWLRVGYKFSTCLYPTLSSFNLWFVSLVLKVSLTDWYWDFSGGNWLLAFFLPPTEFEWYFLGHPFCFCFFFWNSCSGVETFSLIFWRWQMICHRQTRTRRLGADSAAPAERGNGPPPRHENVEITNLSLTSFSLLAELSSRTNTHTHTHTDAQN